MTPATITLRSTHGRYLTAGSDGRVEARALEVGPWEYWAIIPIDDYRVALQTAHGTYLTAARDDARQVPQCAATVIGPWEAWAVVPSVDGVALQGEHGGFLTAGLEGQVEARALEPGPWETWISDPPDWWRAAPPNVVAPAGILGRLRIEHGCFVDDAGYVLPVFAHAGDLFSQYVRDPAFALGQLDDLVLAGYHGARVWFTLGCGRDALCAPTHFWGGRECGPNHTANYWDQVGTFLIEMHLRGLRAVWSQGDPAQTGGDMDARQAYARQVANVARQVDGAGHILAYFDAGNEAWQNDSDRFYSDGNPDHSKHMAAFVKAYTAAGGTALTTTTSPPSELPEQMDEYTPAGVNLWDCHSYRGGNSWDKRRHIFTLPYENGGPKCSRVGIGSEPPGNGVLVSAQEGRDQLDDEAMALLAAASLIGRTAHVWFSGEGVKLRYESPDGLKAMMGFRSVPAVQRLLPRDVMSYHKLHHSGDTWAGTRVFQLTRADARMDGAIATDGRFAYTADGPEGGAAFIVEKPFTAQLITPSAEPVSEPIEGHPGDRLELHWKRGRVLVGQVTSGATATTAKTRARKRPS